MITKNSIQYLLFFCLVAIFGTNLKAEENYLLEGIRSLFTNPKNELQSHKDAAQSQAVRQTTMVKRIDSENGEENQQISTDIISSFAVLSVASFIAVWIRSTDTYKHFIILILLPCVIAAVCNFIAIDQFKLEISQHMISILGTFVGAVGGAIVGRVIGYAANYTFATEINLHSEVFGAGCAFLGIVIYFIGQVYYKHLRDNQAELRTEIINALVGKNKTTLQAEAEGQKKSSFWDYFIMFLLAVLCFLMWRASRKKGKKKDHKNKWGK